MSVCSCSYHSMLSVFTRYSKNMFTLAIIPFPYLHRVYTGSKFAIMLSTIQFLLSISGHNLSKFAIANVFSVFNITALITLIIGYKLSSHSVYKKKLYTDGSS